MAADGDADILRSIDPEDKKIHDPGFSVPPNETEAQRRVREARERSFQRRANLPDNPQTATPDQLPQSVQEDPQITQLTKSLEKSQEQIVELKRITDEATKKAAVAEDEVRRLRQEAQDMERYRELEMDRKIQEAISRQVRIMQLGLDESIQSAYEKGKRDSSQQSDRYIKELNEVITLLREQLQKGVVEGLKSSVDLITKVSRQISIREEDKESIKQSEIGAWVTIADNDKQATNDERDITHNIIFLRSDLHNLAVSELASIQKLAKEGKQGEAREKLGKLQSKWESFSRSKKIDLFAYYPNVKELYEIYREKQYYRLNENQQRQINNDPRIQSLQAKLGSEFKTQSNLALRLLLVSQEGGFRVRDVQSFRQEYSLKSSQALSGVITNILSGIFGGVQR